MSNFIFIIPDDWTPISQELIDTIGAVQIDNWVKMADFYSLGAALREAGGPDFIPGGMPLPGKKSRLRHAARAGVLLDLQCALSASAAVRISAAAAVDGEFRANSTAGLRLSGRAELAARAEIAVGADVVDVVLEMLLYDA